jgi:hypothetical protein
MGNGRIDGAVPSTAYVPAGPVYPVAIAQEGETLSQLANRLHGQGINVDVSTLLKLNPHLSDTTRLTAGQQVQMPMSAGENLPMVEGVSDPSKTDSTSSAAPPTVAKDDPINKSMVQMKLDGTAPGSKLVGMSLGKNSNHQDVTVKREIGSVHGYDDKLQAMAVARLSHAEPAALVQVDGKWHAVQTTADAKYFDGKQETRTHTEGKLTVQGLPSHSEIVKARQEFVTTKKELGTVNHVIDNQQAQSSQQAKEERQERDRLEEKLKAAQAQLAKLMFGDDVQFIRSPIDKTPGKINIVAKLEAAGDEGPVFQQGDHFKDMQTAIEVRLDQLEDPDRAEGVLYHEVSHSQDTEFAQQWVNKYEHESNHIFVDGAPGKQIFQNWIDAQTKTHPPRLSKAEAELIVDMAERDGRTTEAKAFVHSALAALQAGNPEVCKKEFTAYANNTFTEHHRSGIYQNPKDGSEVKQALIHELQSEYKKMPKEMQTQLDEAVAAARAANPESWLSHLPFPPHKG